MDMLAWLEAHDKLAGWAQFAGAMLALSATYLTAFIPIWNRKRQLRKAATRLLSHGYEVLESYHRTTPNFLLSALTLQGAALAIGGVSEEISRFPIYELDDQGSRSLARYLVAVNASLVASKLVFDDLALTASDCEISTAERDDLVTFLGERLDQVRRMLAGEELKRPEWSDFEGRHEA